MTHLSRLALPAGALEVACDESGAEGEHLAGATTDVFAHATVAVTRTRAERAISEIRELIGSPALEYKANHLLRRKHREVLRWFLGAAGPVHGTARVHLVEKEYFLLQRLSRFLLDDAQVAAPLYRWGSRNATHPVWEEFLHAANELMRTRAIEEPGDPIDTFYAALVSVSSVRNDVLDRLAGTRTRAARLRPELVGDATGIPILDPLFPSITRAVEIWGTEERPVTLVHDEQRSLAPDRVATLSRAVNGRLAGIRLVDSMDDPRVQLADFLAGVARWIASEELAGRGERDLTGALAAYVDPGSVWADPDSWSRLAPGALAG